MRSVTYDLYSPLLAVHYSGNQEWDGRSMWHVWWVGELCTGLWWEIMRERDHLKYLGVDGRIILKLVLRNSVGSAWTGLIRLMTGASVGLT